VLDNLSFTARAGSVLAICGANGSGKSTLLKILAGLSDMDRGNVHITCHAMTYNPFTMRSNIGYVSPELSMYEELSAAENLRFFAALRNVPAKRKDLIELLEKVGLRGRGTDLVSGYSSGMKQRLRLAFALQHNPLVLMLDEPTSCLDEAGIAIVQHIVEEKRKQGLVLIATNEARERKWADEIIQLD
jgi:ABC-type multidrug transport system ATPase subunit